MDSRNVRSTKWSVRKEIWQSKQFFEYHFHELRTPSQKIFCKSINFKIKYCKKFPCKIRLYYQTVIDQRLIAFHQLFSWTSAGSPNARSIKWSVRKAIWQPQEFPDYPIYRLRAPSLKIFSKWIIFQITYCKKVHCPLSKFILHSLTASWSKASCLSPTVQLDFSWTHEISYRQNDRFARGSDSLSNSLSTMGTIWELLQRIFFGSL